MTNLDSDSFFNDDLPITEEAADRLDRVKQAYKLADDIQNYLNSQNDKLKQGASVIGILGKWGEGKTSFINLVRKKLDEESSKSQGISISCNNKNFKCEKLRQGCKECDTDETIKIIPWDPWNFPAKSDLAYQLYESIYPKCKLLIWETITYYLTPVTDKRF